MTDPRHERFHDTDGPTMTGWLDRRTLMRGAAALGLTGAALAVASPPQPALVQDATPEADVEERKTTMRRWFTEGWAGNLALADEIFAPTFTNNGNEVGPEGPKRNVDSRLTGFPDLQSTVDEQLADGDHVVTRVTWRGTHQGPYLGLPPTGNTVEVRGIITWRFEDGWAVEDWTVIDLFGLLNQLDALPPEITVPPVATPAP